VQLLRFRWWDRVAFWLRGHWAELLDIEKKMKLVLSHGVRSIEITQILLPPRQGWDEKLIIFLTNDVK